MAIVTKKYSWEAAHFLPNHFGKCRGMHGHSYAAEIKVYGEIKNPFATDSDAGMVVDFYELSEAMKPLIEQYLDHKLLNESLKEWLPLPTAELIAIWIFGKLTERELRVISVRVWETADCSAEVDSRDYDVWRRRRAERENVGKSTTGSISR